MVHRAVGGGTLDGGLSILQPQVRTRDKKKEETRRRTRDEYDVVHENGRSHLRIGTQELAYLINPATRNSKISVRLKNVTEALRHMSQELKAYKIRRHHVV